MSADQEVKTDLVKLGDELISSKLMVKLTTECRLDLLEGIDQDDM